MISIGWRRTWAQLACLWLLAGVGASALPQAPQRTWYQYYDEAERAIEAGEWDKAWDALANVFRARPPSPGRSVRRQSGDFRLFAPDYLYALIYVNTGRPKEALKHLDGLAKLNIIRKGDSEYDRYIATRQRAEQLLSAQKLASISTTTIPPPPPSTASPTSAPTTSVATTAVTTSIPATSIPDLRPAFEDLLRQAQQQAAAGAFAAGEALVNQARGLNVDSVRADQVLRQIREQHATSVAGRVEGAIRRRDPAAAEVELNRLLEIEPAHGRAGEFRRAISGLRSESAERSVMRAFFEGQYLMAVSQARAESAANRSGRLLFYHACALVALALQTDPPSPAGLQEARQVLARAVQTGQDLSVDRKYISPKILQALEGR